MFIARLSRLHLALAFSLTPRLAWASTPGSFSELVQFLVGYINLLITLLLAAAFIFLVWKIIDAWIIHVADEKKRTEGKQYAMIAVVIFVLAVSVWGIVSLLQVSIFGPS